MQFLYVSFIELFSVFIFKDLLSYGSIVWTIISELP